MFYEQTASCVQGRQKVSSKVTSCVLCDSQLAKHHKNYIMTSVKGLREDTHTALAVTLDTECRLVKGYMEMICSSTWGKIKQT